MSSLPITFANHFSHTYLPTCVSQSSHATSLQEGLALPRTLDRRAAVSRGRLRARRLVHAHRVAPHDSADDEHAPCAHAVSLRGVAPPRAGGGAEARVRRGKYSIKIANICIVSACFALANKLFRVEYRRYLFPCFRKFVQILSPPLFVDAYCATHLTFGAQHGRVACVDRCDSAAAGVAGAAAAAVSAGSVAIATAAQRAGWSERPERTQWTGRSERSVPATTVYRFVIVCRRRCRAAAAGRALYAH